MNYIWSKKKLLEFLNESINQITWNKFTSIADLFAWTWIVGRFYKGKGKKVISNDLQYYSYVLNKWYIGVKSIYNLQFEKLWWFDKVFESLNDLPGNKGFMYNNYSPWVGEITHWRMYFTNENAKKCDAIRSKIEEYKNNSLISEDEYFFLLASLIESIDKVSNTAAIYWAYLKQFKKSALKTFILEPLIFDEWKYDNVIYNKNVNDLISELSHVDVVYLDPPYNERQYAWNYHILETIAKYDTPEITWKTWMRKESNKSKYCSKSIVKKEFENLIMNINSDYIFVSYNNEWLLSIEDMEEILSKRGEYGLFKKEYQRFKSDKDVNRTFSDNKTYEYLHYVKCKKD